jgi:hypothetical protein
MKDRELMEKARDALRVFSTTIRTNEVPALVELIDDLNIRIEQIKDDEEFYSLSKEARDKMKLAARGNRNLWKPELDPKYQKAKELRASGMLLKDACAVAEITVDQWYRRQRIEQLGTDRPGRYAQ